MPSSKNTYMVGIRSVADYSPFGVELDGRTQSGGGYRYSFQGQEKDDEVKGEGNSINYKYRMHDPRIGRFFAVDPLTHGYPFYSPYHFSSNSPIMAIEIEGLESSVEINYPEGSITIVRDADNRLTVTADQLRAIEGHYSGDLNPGRTERNLVPGGVMDVECRACGPMNTSYYIKIYIPEQQVVDDEEVCGDYYEREIPGTGSDPVAPTQGTPERELPVNKKTIGNFNWSGGSSNSSLSPSNSTNVSKAVKGVRRAYYKAKNKQLTNNPNWSFSRSNGMTLYVREDCDFNDKVHQELEKLFNMTIEMLVDPDIEMTSGDPAELKLVSNNVFIETIPATEGTEGSPGTPPETELVRDCETVPIVKEPIVVTP